MRPALSSPPSNTHAALPDQARKSCFLLCSRLRGAAEPPLQEQQAYVFGTRVEVLVVSSEPEAGAQAIAAVLREFDRLHRATTPGSLPN
jgi:hypothetical protein